MNRDQKMQYAAAPTATNMMQRPISLAPSSAQATAPNMNVAMIATATKIPPAIDSETTMTPFINTRRFYVEAFAWSILVTGLFLLAYPVHAQSPSQARVVSGCGSQSLSAGTNAPVTQDTTGVACGGGGGGSFEFNSSAIPVVQNGSYSAGQSLGGLQIISIGNTAGITGILTQIQLSSKGGSVVGSVVYVWQKNPSGTTCTDKTNFVASATDNQQLIVQPQLITPAVIVSAQDTFTYGASTNLIAPFVNGSATSSLYACILANATVTPGTTSDLRLNLQGAKDQQ